MYEGVKLPTRFMMLLQIQYWFLFSTHRKINRRKRKQLEEGWCYYSRPSGCRKESRKSYEGLCVNINQSILVVSPGFSSFYLVHERTYEDSAVRQMTFTYTILLYCTSTPLLCMSVQYHTNTVNLEQKVVSLIVGDALGSWHAAVYPLDTNN